MSFEDSDNEVDQKVGSPSDAISTRPPSSTNAPLLKSYTYATPLPTDLKPDQECILGVDEAGRGPVLGPMVYGICYCPIDRQDELKTMGFADSKTLKEDERDSLLDVIVSRPDMIGWSVRVLSPMDISNSMLRQEKYNLNALAHDTTIQLIRDTLDKGVNIREVYVDTVGPPETYQKKLEGLFPKIAKITVAKKADSKYPIVSAASICAKVTRDDVLRHWIFAEEGIKDTISREFGSGYPSGRLPVVPSTVLAVDESLSLVTECSSICFFGPAAILALARRILSLFIWGLIADLGRFLGIHHRYVLAHPKTVQWLKKNMDPVFGYPNIVRFSWGTCKTLLDASGTAVRWPNEDEEDQRRISTLFNRTEKDASELAEQKRQYSTFIAKAPPRPVPQLMQDMGLKSVIDF
ncbi:Ribonuclease H2 subunit A [Actinomortierella ambigua]|nr:Ribonuclease H2 subunit A [Actinomortierella ambigua]